MRLWQLQLLTLAAMAGVLVLFSAFGRPTMSAEMRIICSAAGKSAELERICDELR